jgi:hypothetical protein
MFAHKTEDQCKWFLMCKNHAVTTLTHPILGDVKICDRCLNNTMRMTDFESYEGKYDMPHILYRLAYDHNSGADSEDQLSEPEDGADIWNIPLAPLLCITGTWTKLGFGENGDPTLPDWKDLGIDHTEIGDECGVYYVGDHLIVMGDNGIVACYWIYKKS